MIETEMIRVESFFSLRQEAEDLYFRDDRPIA